MPTRVVSAREGGRHYLPGRVGGGGGGKLPFLVHGRGVGRHLGRDPAAGARQLLRSGRDEDAADGGRSGCRAQWASLPMELLVEVIRRVEDREASWPGRREVVTCAAVCRSWREATSEVVRSVEKSGLITFPVSLKQLLVSASDLTSKSCALDCFQPGPRDSPIQCFIRRERATSTYYLYMGLSPVLLTDSGKFLLAARRMRRATSTDFVISLASDDFSRASTMYIGKLRTNFLGTKFTIYDNQPPSDVASVSTSTRSSIKRRIHSKQVSPRVSAGNYRAATISYEINVLRSRGPRRMKCTMHSIPYSVARRGSASSSSSSPPTPSFSTLSLQDSSSSSPSPIQTPTSSITKGTVFSSTSSSCYRGSSGSGSPTSVITTMSTSSGFQPLVLKNKAPRWHEQLQCWCLNFRGRVTVASVKNFQLVAAAPVDPSQPAGSPTAAAAVDEERVMLQFGKIGKDIFTMDYLHPLSAFQAFAICLSSFDTKPVCE